MFAPLLNTYIIDFTGNIYSPEVSNTVAQSRISAGGYRLIDKLPRENKSSNNMKGGANAYFFRPLKVKR